MPQDKVHVVRRSKDLGVALREQRKSLGLTQTGLSQRSAVNQGRISEIESGRCGTSIERLFDLIAALDLELVVRPRTKSSVEDIVGLFT